LCFIVAQLLNDLGIAICQVIAWLLLESFDTVTFGCLAADANLLLMLGMPCSQKNC
jgi:hypothetical protein